MMRWLAIALVIAATGRATHAQPSPEATGSDSDQADRTTDPTSPKANAAVRYTAGQQKFDAGDFLGAAGEFEAAYALDPDPVYLYNTAQAYRRGSACARAADYYRRFLAVVANPPNLDKVHRYLSDLDACAKAETVEQPTPTPLETAPTTAPAIAPSTPLQPIAEGDRRIGIPLAVASAGVVALAVGGWLTHDVDTLEGFSQALCAPGMTCSWDASKQARADSLQSRGNRDSVISIAAYGVGGAAILTAVLLYAFGAREPVAITPLAGGAAITGSVAF